MAGEGQGNPPRSKTITDEQLRQAAEEGIALRREMEERLRTAYILERWDNVLKRLAQDD
jgi:hypothetical protein